MKKRKYKLEYEHICLQCGKKFKTHKKNIVVCSPKCALTRKREKDRAYWQKYYAVPENKAKQNANSRAWWKKNKGPKKEREIKVKEKKEIKTYKKECLICKEEFITHNNNTEHCILHRYRRRPSNVYPCTCRFCGNEFWSKHKTDTVCLNPICIKKSQR